MTIPAPLDLRKIRHSFERAAQHYDRVAVLQQEINARMLERLSYIQLQSHTILDMGCGTGYALSPLQHIYPHARFIGLDLAFTMLQQLQSRHPIAWWKWWQQRKRKLVQADMHQLPFADESFELVWSNLALQWSNDPAYAFQEVQRVLKIGGLFMFSTFGPDTLKELRYSYAQTDQTPHIHFFTDMHDLGDLLVGAGFADPVVDAEWMTLTYHELIDQLRELRALGATNALQNRGKGLFGKQALQHLTEAYNTLRNAEGLLPATYEVIYGHAWKVQPKTPEIFPMQFIQKR